VPAREAAPEVPGRLGEGVRCQGGQDQGSGRGSSQGSRRKGSRYGGARSR